MSRLVLVVCVVAAAGCGRAPAPPYPLKFALEGSSPRVLRAGAEITVPVQIVNTGPRGWDPSRVHLSYHWLWFVPREIASRSRWNVPYHEGIRTELTGAMAPGGRASLDGRLLAPSLPGLYWLQWDMVEEGSTWFAQVAPRQPRSLVVVVPPPVWWLAPLPLVVAVIGIAFSRTSAAPSVDIAWCVACVFAKPFVIYHEALLEPAALAYWLTLVAAIVPVGLVAVAFPRGLRLWALLVLGILGSLVILADIVYYRFFGDVLSTPALLGLGQTGQVWGSVRSLFTPGLWWLLADIPFAIWLALRLSRLERRGPAPRRWRLAVAIAIGLLVFSSVQLAWRRMAASGALDQTFRDRAVVEQIGVFGFHVYDTWNFARATWLRPPVTEAQIAEATAWFAERAPLRAGAAAPAFGAARGKSVIVVQVESLQEFAVDYRVGSQEVMPHLRRWTTDSVRFTNVTDQTSEGRTSDAELATMASLLPLDHGSAAFRYPGNHYTALPRVLVEHGYQTLSAVAFEPGFWNRRVMHPAYGFQRTLFEPDFELTEQIGWGLNDRDFLRQMTPRLAALPRPFLAWLITLSLHHPFADFPAAHRALKLGELEGTSLGNYLHAMRFFDDALESFKSALAANGLLDDVVLVVFGDHDAGFSRTSGDEVEWVLRDRVPLFIRGGGLRGIRTIAAGQTDVAPTLLALLGINAAPLPYVGRNLLGAAEAPEARPYGEWIDDRRLFLTRTVGDVCIDLVGRRPGDRAACDAANDAVRRERDVSRLVVVDDLQQRIRERLAAAVR